MTDEFGSYSWICFTAVGGGTGLSLVACGYALRQKEIKGLGYLYAFWLIVKPPWTSEQA